MLVALGVVYAFAVHSVASRKGQLASRDRAGRRRQRGEPHRSRPTSRSHRSASSRLQQVATLAQQRFNWPDAMEQLALALPNDVTLISFSANDGAASVNQTSTGVPSFTLDGCASAQAEIPSVLTSLAGIPGVSDVQLTSSTENLRSKGKVPAKDSEANNGGCPYVAFIVDLSYSNSYTVPSAKSSSGSSSGAQTVSTSTGASTAITQTSKQQVTG